MILTASYFWDACEYDARFGWGVFFRGRDLEGAADSPVEYRSARMVVAWVLTIPAAAVVGGVGLFVFHLTGL